MRFDEQCERRAAAGEAGAADVPERDPVAEAACLRATHHRSGWSLARGTFCRAGFAGRGTASAQSTARHTLPSARDPRRSLGSHP